MRVQTGYDNRNGFKKCGNIILSILRSALPMLLLHVLAVRAQAVYLPLLHAELSVATMRSIMIVLHVLSLWCGLHSEGNRGFVYEASSCFLATEITLFLYFLQHQPAVGVLIGGVLLGGLILLLTHGRKQLEILERCGFVPQVLRNDVMDSSGRIPTPNRIFAAAVRRYCVIGTAILLAAPSVAVLGVYGMSGVKQYGNRHAMIESGQKNPMQLNDGMIQLLKDEIWCNLSEQEKTDVLQIIADIETYHLGIESVIVVNVHLEGEITGAYDYGKRHVQIDLGKHVDDEPLEYVRTILHECRHAFQRDCIESLNWDDPAVQSGIYYAKVRQWRYEHIHYVSSSRDPSTYYDQMIERDARAYADNGLSIYQEHLCFMNIPARHENEGALF